MSDVITFPILSDIVSDGFIYGANYLVEFEPDSLWYETSLTIAAHALKHGLKTEYHTFMHIPNEVMDALSKLGLNLKELEQKGVFRILDTYTGLTGLPLLGEPSYDSREISSPNIRALATTNDKSGMSVDISKPSWLQDTTAAMVKLIKEGVPEEGKRWLHIDDNTTMFNRYFKEQEIVDIFQNRIVPLIRIRESVAFHSVVTGIASDAFYRQFESECDGIIDFKGREEGGRLEQYLRVRSLRGRTCDSRWRRLKLLGNGEVAIARERERFERLPLEVSEGVIGRIATGYENLDNLLLGGLPQNYAVALTSPSCDERDLLTRRFLETGTKRGEVTFYVTTDPGNAKALAEGFQSNFHLFVCNPQPDAIIRNLPNVSKLKGVENLTDISIALTSTIRRLDPSLKGPRRICIGLISDLLLQHHAVQTRRWLTGLISELRSSGFTTLAVMDPEMHPSQEVRAVLDLFEGQIDIYEKETEKGSEKFLKIKKMTNQRYLKDELLLKEEEMQK